MDNLNDSTSEGKNETLTLQEEIEIEEIVSRTRWTFYESLKNFMWDTGSLITNDQP
jgi:hypothetical protein